MAKHSTRGANGRFTKSGAPIPDESGQGDTSAYALGADPSADPQGEHTAPGYPSFDREYPTREFSHPDGSYSPLRGRKQIVVNAQTGEALDAHITDVRAADARSNFGQGSRVVTVTDNGLGGEFGDAQYLHYDGPDTMRGYRRMPGTGKRLPSMGATDQDAEQRGGR